MVNVTVREAGGPEVMGPVPEVALSILRCFFFFFFSVSSPSFLWSFSIVRFLGGLICGSRRSGVCGQVRRACHYQVSVVSIRGSGAVCVYERSF